MYYLKIKGLENYFPMKSTEYVLSSGDVVSQLVTQVINSEEKENFNIELGRLYWSWRSLIDKHLMSIGMTQSRWLTLYYISRSSEELSQKDLALSMGIEGPTLVRLLDALESMNLIERSESKSDRRRKVISITEKGRPLVEEIKTTINDFRDEFLSDLTKEEISEVILHTTFYAGWPVGANAVQVAKEVFDERGI